MYNYFLYWNTDIEVKAVSKNKKIGNKHLNNVQEKLSNAVNSVNGNNQNHNAKKEGLGPNTKR